MNEEGVTKVIVFDIYNLGDLDKVLQNLGWQYLVDWRDKGGEGFIDGAQAVAEK